jgi:aspartate/methionine/tyrosine aminotransferase
MTGWRLGWLVAPPDLVRPIERLAQNLYIAAPTLAQHAAIEALTCYQELDRRIDRYRANRDLVLERLCPLGLDRFAPPDGAFYLYFDIAHLGCSTSLCRQLLEETGVALAPGADFDRGRGERFLRLAFCGAAEEVREGADRLARWLARRR